MTSRSRVGWGRWSLGACLLLACGSPPAHTLVVDNSTNVTIHAEGTRGKSSPAIDSDDPRVLVARREITTLLGHPLGFELDAAVAANFGDGLQQAYVSALETVAGSLARCKKRAPKSFASGAAALQRLRFSYDPALSEQSPASDLIDSALVIAVHSESRQLLDGSELCPAFERGLERDEAGRFASVDPARVPAAQQAAYFDFLIHDRSADVENQQDQNDLRRASRMLAFYPHIVQPDVRAEANSWLCYFGSTLSRIMRKESNDAVLVTLIGKVQPAWIGWVNANSTQLEPNDRQGVAEILFRHQSPDVPTLAQGFDSYAFGLPIIEQWVEKLAFVDPRKSEDRLYIFVVCRAEREHRDKPALFVQKYCNGVFFGDLVRTPLGRKRLSLLLKQQKNELLTQTAMLHALRAADADSVVLLLDLLADDAAVTHAALRALADYSDWRVLRASPGDKAVVSDPQPLVASAPRWWKSLPEQRPALLYLLTELARKREGSVPLPKLAQLLGSRIDATALAGFLAEEHDAMKALPKLLPALSPGWPRSRVIVPSFEAWLDADAQGRSSDSEAYYVTSELVESLCDAGVASDLGALQQALRTRGERYPTQAKRLSSFTQPTTAALCPRLNRPKSRQKTQQPVLFGD